MRTNIVQLNEYETDPYFFQFFRNNTRVCCIIYMFCKSCEPEIVQKKIKTKNYPKKVNKNNFRFANLTKHVKQHCLALEILKKISICLKFI